MASLIMGIISVILSILLGLVMLGSGVTKLARTAQAVGMMQDVGVQRSLVPVLGGLQVAAAAGLFVGLFIPVLGVVTAACCALYFAGAITVHLRARRGAIQAAIVLFALSVATLTVLSLNM
ncbi:DoxX family protein [Curtobacterium sp. SL109]|uniref:DoxX family protein n=1 Tax=Curtobacterium sp. SL109 TaxID=2994662 RepID=UPI002274DC6E|nr:DoxX family protein [Curtobacterium sp. SL109]MCY1693721.1 DoxX family protein [Curtobacterium sp. SL109]